MKQRPISIQILLFLYVLNGIVMLSIILQQYITTIGTYLGEVTLVSLFFFEIPCTILFFYIPYRITIYKYFSFLISFVFSLAIIILFSFPIQLFVSYWGTNTMSSRDIFLPLFFVSTNVFILFLLFLTKKNLFIKK